MCAGCCDVIKQQQDGSFFASGGADQLVMVWKSNFLSPAEEEASRPKHTGATSSSPPRPRKPTPIEHARRPKAPAATVEEQRSSSNRLSRSTVNINQPPGVARQMPPPPRPSPAPRPTASVQVSSQEHRQRSHISAAAAAALETLPPPPTQRTTATLGMPDDTPTTEKTQPALDRNALPAGLVETMDHIVGQVRKAGWIDTIDCCLTVRSSVA